MKHPGSLVPPCWEKGRLEKKDCEALHPKAACVCREKKEESGLMLEVEDLTPLEERLPNGQVTDTNFTISYATRRGGKVVEIFAHYVRAEHLDFVDVPRKVNPNSNVWGKN